jgi:NADPH-dependent 7-cyano-7-deazaguanine reductase QueF-like protein
MINKGGAPGENQTMMFNIPVDVMNQQKEMKVYINSKKENQKLDWENFSMYLAIDLPVFGNTGIKISAINRDMKISIKNDRDDIEIIKDALVDSFKEDLKEIGYNIVSVNIGKLSEKEGEAMLKSVSVSQSKVSSYFPDKKGFDLKL